jgi:hypothetical protein
VYQYNNKEMNCETQKMLSDLEQSSRYCITSGDTIPETIRYLEMTDIDLILGWADNSSDFAALNHVLRHSFAYADIPIAAITNDTSLENRLKLHSSGVNLVFGSFLTEQVFSKAIQSISCVDGREFCHYRKKAV